MSVVSPCAFGGRCVHIKEGQGHDQSLCSELRGVSFLEVQNVLCTTYVCSFMVIAMSIRAYDLFALERLLQVW